jgi:hypothetical protein
LRSARGAGAAGSVVLLVPELLLFDMLLSLVVVLFDMLLSVVVLEALGGADVSFVLVLFVWVDVLVLGFVFVSVLLITPSLERAFVCALGGRVW